MKKLYVLFSLALAGNVLAQGPTITISDMPTVGSNWVDMIDTSLTTFNITAGSGSAQSWNYSTAFPNANPSANYVVSPTGLQGASNYPSATAAITHPADSSNEFYLLNSSGLYLDGTYDYTVGGTGALDFSPNLVYFPLPASYNNSFPVNNARVHFSMAGTGYQVDYYITYKSTFTADAYGSLQTPAGSYSNTLRVKAFRQLYDSVYLTIPPGPPSLYQTATDTAITYFWVRNAGATGSIVMSADFDKNNNVKSASYYGGLAGIKENDGVLVSVYPNPTTGKVTISLPQEEKATVYVYDVSGRKVAETASEKTKEISLSLSDLSPGMYFYNVNTSHYSKSGRLTKE